MLRFFILLCSIFCLSCAHAQKDEATFTLNPIGGNIYVHYGQHLDIDTGYQGDICNLSVVIGTTGIAVIDSGGSLNVGKKLRDAIKKISNLPILYVINTHVHPDHIFGNAAFIEDKPTFVGHKKLGDAMQLRAEAYEKLNIKLLGTDANGSSIVKPTLMIEGPTSVNLGNRTLTITPYENAHTNTDISVLDSQTQTLFTGDLLFIERTPVVEGDIKGLIATLENLKTYSIEQIVPGHGPMTKDWLKALNDEQRYLTLLLADIRSIIKKGGTMTEAMDFAASSEKANWLLFDIANRRNVNTLYPTLEWE